MTHNDTMTGSFANDWPYAVCYIYFWSPHFEIVICFVGSNSVQRCSRWHIQRQHCPEWARHPRAAQRECVRQGDDQDPGHVLHSAGDWAWPHIQEQVWQQKPRAKYWEKLFWHLLRVADTVRRDCRKRTSGWFWTCLLAPRCILSAATSSPRPGGFLLPSCIK